MASEKEHRPSVLDFLVAALNEHDGELSALGDSLKESIRLERLVEKYESTIDRLPNEEIILKKSACAEVMKRGSLSKEEDSEDRTQVSPIIG